MNALTAMQRLPDVQAQQDFREQRIEAAAVARIGRPKPVALATAPTETVRAVARPALSGVSS